MLAWINVANAEFNIENNLNQPVYIKLGYQNVLNSSFIYTDVSKNVDLKKISLLFHMAKLQFY